MPLLMAALWTDASSSTDRFRPRFLGWFSAIVSVMTAMNQPAVRVSEPSDLIDAIPYLIGFHPEESLVLVGFRHSDVTSRRRQVAVSVRVDLPPEPVTAEQLEFLAGALARSGVDTCVAVILTRDVGEDPTEDLRWALVATTLGTACSEHGIELDDVLVADEHRWWSLACLDEQCCSRKGTERTKGASVVAAEATVAGLVALPDRGAVERLIEPLPAEERARLAGALAVAEDRTEAAWANDRGSRLRRTDLRALFAEMAAWSRPGERVRAMTPRRLARFAVALGDIGIRDEVWMAIDGGTAESDEFLRDMIRRLPSPYDAPPLFLFGWSQWRKGNGTLAAIAAERALMSDPGYSAARLLQTAVLNGINPQSMPPLGESLVASS